VRLNKAHPDTIVGVKDSSGNWPAMQAVIQAIPGFRTFAGTEQYLLADLQAGGAGCITATGNATSNLCQAVYTAFKAGDAAGAEAAQEIATATRLMLQPHGAVPAMKELMAQNSGKHAPAPHAPIGRRHRRPGQSLPGHGLQAGRGRLNSHIDIASFSMPLAWEEQQHLSARCCIWRRKI